MRTASLVSDSELPKFRDFLDNRGADFERCGRGRRWRIADVERLAGAHNQKILDKLAIWPHCLSSNSCARRNQVPLLNLGDQLLHRFKKQFLAEGPQHFTPAC